MTFLAACVSADPTLVAQAVASTLTAVITPTPIVVVVTAVGAAPPQIASVTPDAEAQQTQAAATATLLAASAPAPSTQLGAGPVESAAPTTPTATPTPAPLTPGVPPVPVGAVVFQDDFNQPALWAALDDANQRIGVADGRLEMTLKVEDRFALAYRTRLRAADFFASVKGAVADCRFRDRYGLLFRLQDGLNYYQFEVDCDGRYRVAKVVAGTLAVLKDWTLDNAIVAGADEANTLGVRATGAQIDVFVNGHNVAQVTDSDFAEGGFGLYAGSGVSKTFTVQFDDLGVWEVK